MVWYQVSSHRRRGICMLMSQKPECVDLHVGHVFSITGDDFNKKVSLGMYLCTVHIYIY